MSARKAGLARPRTEMDEIFARNNAQPAAARRVRIVVRPVGAHFGCSAAVVDRATSETLLEGRLYPLGSGSQARDDAAQAVGEHNRRSHDTWLIGVQS